MQNLATDMTPGFLETDKKYALRCGVSHGSDTDKGIWKWVFFNPVFGLHLATGLYRGPGTHQVWCSTRKRLHQQGNT